MKYRAEIDGLRAIAVVPVILFHAGLDLFSGGFVGVDMFFVISGYLITTILIEDIENRRFSIVNFYERRARRILPALFFVMLVCIPFAWMMLSDAVLNKFGSGLIGVSVFLSNVVFWRQQGYFADSAELNPILHTWSLAVEEQYYLLFPLFLILAWRFGKNRVIWMIVAMAIISLLLSEWGWRNTPGANFYLAPTRAWELFAGTIAAFIVQKKGVQSSNRLSLIGLAAIIFSIFAYDESTPFPSVYALIPVLGVVLLVLYADRETLAAKLLSTKGMVGIGLISYSAYLWHQPVFAFVRVYNQKISLDWFTTLVLIIATFILSYVSWRFIEKPFRARNVLKKYTLFASSTTSLLIIFAIGYASKRATIDMEYKLAYLLSQNNYVYYENMDDRRFIEARLFYPLEPVNSIIVGSSRVMQINSSTIGKNIQSLTVAGASIEDDIVFGLEALAKLNYQNIYISADPWLLNRFDGQNNYQSVSELLDYWMNRLDSHLPPIQFLDSSYSESETAPGSNVFSSLRNHSLPDKYILPIDGQIEASMKRAYDGSLIYDESKVNQSFDIQKHSRQLHYAMREFDYDIESIEKLEKFVSYLKSNNIIVTLILSPYHPNLYQLMETRKPIYLEIEDWYREFAERNGIRIIGSYDGRIVGCGENEFYDGMHPTSSCMQKLFLDTNE